MSVYGQLWKNSAHLKPTDLTQVLIIISTWIRIGVKPCNLFSEAFRLLPDQLSKETVILCAFYKALGCKLGLPCDDEVYSVIENFLHERASELSMLELVVICSAFFRSFMPFQIKRSSSVVHGRFLELLSS